MSPSVLSPDVIAELEASSEQLGHENRAEAQQRLLAISAQVNALHDASETMKDKLTQEQKAQTDLLAAVLKSESDIHNQALDTQSRIDATIAEFSKDQADANELEKQIEALRSSIEATKAQMAEHQARLEERRRYLNNTSALSIFVSVVSLGMDRAFTGIQTLVEDDARRISDLNDELSHIVQSYTTTEDALTRDNTLLSNLEHQRQTLAQQLSAYQSKEESLRAQERSYRAKVAWLTAVALFYGKLALICTDVDHRLDDVNDIVSVLNDSTPTITDFDGSGETLISLKEALARFDTLLRQLPTEAAEPGTTS